MSQISFTLLHSLYEVFSMLDQHFLMEKSKHFCMLPWVHMHLWPNGNTYPCCVWNSQFKLGEYGNESFEDIWNSTKMKELRTNMLNDLPTEGCNRCYDQEANGAPHTLRTSSNSNYQHHWKKVLSTHDDGNVPGVNMAYLDIRFSNLCNLRCNSCGPELSSAWYDDQVKAFGKPQHDKVISVDQKRDFWKEIEPLLENVEGAYFAGGEPLMCEEHYRILDLWREKGKKDVRINYTTNFTTLRLKQWRTLEYWQDFPNVSVSASLDDDGARAEYLRKGTVWDVVVQNRIEMMVQCPNVYFEITPTISIYNIFHFPEFHLDWIEKGLVEPNNLRLNILSHPEYMSACVLPQALKDQAIDKWQEYGERIRVYAIKVGKPWDTTYSSYLSVVTFLRSSDQSHRIPALIERTGSIDKVRNENVLDVYPELTEVWNQK